MALRSLMLKKKIDEINKSLEQSRAKAHELETREAELETAIEEASTDEEKTTVEEAVASFEEEKKANEEEVASFEEELRTLQEDLNKEEAKQKEAAAPKEEPKAEKRTQEEKIVMARKKFFGLNHEERKAFLENEEVKSFLQRVREHMKGTEQRAVTGAQLLIPTIVLDLIRENIMEYSKLIKHVNLQRVAGKARQTVQGLIPEAVWTEMCGKLNELAVAFTGVEVDGYKVGGFVPVCNAQLEDSDENLAEAIISAIGAGIGFALDKAIVFGTGTKMPIGIFTRLAQTSDPEDSRTTIPWVDLHSTNIVTIENTATGIALFQAIITDAGIADGNYAKNGMFWVMNHKTYTKLMAESMNINAAGTIVAGAGKEMPVIGGAVEELNFMPDDVIIGGYGELYLLAERQGGEFAKSEHVRFTDDQTVFKGTARYDGLPVIAAGFVAIGINGVTPSASGITFAEDTANPS